ncbi:MAG TPA: TRAP transporter substrate-binding protein [Candidatus Baltobacteraceae bacterium]|nr:TRAP transporter substrate-binding protein [Candidatus Baltobacteraceae bacterium]
MNSKSRSRCSLQSLGLCALIVAALILSVGGFQVAAAGTVLRLTSALGTDHPDVICLEQFVKEVARRTNGEVDIRLFANNALGAPPDTTEQVVRLGTIDMALLASSNIDKYSRAFAMMAVPYMHDDLAHAHRTLDGPALDWFTQEGRKAGFELIALNFEFGFRMTSNNKRLINTPADFKGLKIRIPPEPQSRSIMEAFGAIPQVVAFPDTYLALANNAIDGAELPLSGMISQKWYEVQKFMSMTNHIYVHQMVIANAQVWSKLKPDWQKVIHEEAVAAGSRARKMVADQEKGYIAQMEKVGIKFSYPDLAPFRALAGPSHAELKKWIGDEAWNKYVSYVEAARKK